MNFVKTVAMVLGAGFLLLAPGQAAAAAPGDSATPVPAKPDFSSLPKNVQDKIKHFKIGSYHAPLFKDGVQIGYATLTFEAGRLVRMQRYGLFDAPTEVRTNSVAAASTSCDDGPTVTYVSEDTHNVYYYATFPDGSWIFYSVNKSSGDVTVIGSGKESAEIC